MVTGDFTVRSVIDKQVVEHSPIDHVVGLEVVSTDINFTCLFRQMSHSNKLVVYFGHTIHLLYC